MKKYCLILGILCLISGLAYSQSEIIEEKEIYVPTYSMGDHTIIINLGTYFPLFFTSDENGMQDLNIQIPTGSGSFVWETYINNNVKLGGEIGGSFGSSKNDNTFYMVPFIFRTTYEYRYLNYAFPLRLGLGFVMSSYGEDTHVDPIIKPGISAFWSMNSSWSFGLNLDYSFIPQYMFVDDEQEGAGHFAEVTLAALYHF